LYDLVGEVVHRGGHEKTMGEWVHDNTRTQARLLKERTRESSRPRHLAVSLTF
jgi:hypothetical protein